MLLCLDTMLQSRNRFFLHSLAQLHKFEAHTRNPMLSLVAGASCLAV